MTYTRRLSQLCVGLWGMVVLGCVGVGMELLNVSILEEAGMLEVIDFENMMVVLTHFCYSNLLEIQTSLHWEGGRAAIEPARLFIPRLYLMNKLTCGSYSIG